MLDEDFITNARPNGVASRRITLIEGDLNGIISALDTAGINGGTLGRPKRSVQGTRRRWFIGLSSKNIESISGASRRSIPVPGKTRFLHQSAGNRIAYAPGTIQPGIHPTQVIRYWEFRVNNWIKRAFGMRLDMIGHGKQPGISDERSPIPF